MIKTRIFQFVGHIHNMQLCIEIIIFINNENESILRWFYRFCEPRNFSLCPRNLVGVYSGGMGVWFMTFCCCLVEFGSSCFNHAWIESWFVWFGPWYSTQLCIEMISFINNENESLLRWFYSLCEPRNFSLILCPVAGCIQTGWGSDLCLPAVVLWNSAPHVSTMLGSNLDLSDSVLDILQRATWGWVNDDRVFIFRCTVSLWG